ncbi:MAG: D-2-hydroxyacid dehydrogenase [Chloroflexi bacterium]|nr:MAG: D-2-hydroxyacid dehydrogenase [Chloroflexota bacterium]
MKILLMYPPSADHLAALQAVAPGAELCVAQDEAHAARLIGDAEVVLGNRYFLQSLPYAQRLRWMQSNSMGVDRILTAGVGLDNIVLTNARGVYDDELAEHTLALIFALVRQLHYARDDQQAQRWQRRSLRTIGGMQALILGWGGIGQALAQRLLALGVRVHAARQRHLGPPATDAQDVTMHGPHTWRAALPTTDILLLALPLTPATHHVVGAAELAALPPDALVVNVGRGGTLDEQTLLNALQRDRLSGAGLDVLEHEPLPPDHPLWREPKVLITPHVGRSIERPPFRWEPLFVENVRRYVRGEPLLNVVDQRRGY